MSPESLAPWGHLLASPWWQAGTAATSLSGNAGPGTQCWGSSDHHCGYPRCHPWLATHGDKTAVHRDAVPTHGDATGRPQGLRGRPGDSSVPAAPYLSMAGWQRGRGS